MPPPLDRRRTGEPAPEAEDLFADGQPLSIEAAVARAVGNLLAGGVSTPWLDAELLMGFVLGWTRARLFAHWDEPLDAYSHQRFLDLVARRGRGEPLAYIRNFKEFLGFELYVDGRVLIPRPETELLVARATAVAADRKNLVVADVGTGSGAVAIGLAKALPAARILATDVSAGALDVARLNAGRQGVALDLIQGSLLEALSEPLDLVVANLPYLSLPEYTSLLGTSIAFEPRRALTDEADGLRLFDALFQQVPARLRPGGHVLLEIGSGQSASLLALARMRLPHFRGTIFADDAGLPRVLDLCQDEPMLEVGPPR